VSVLVSHWPINDQVTPTLIPDTLKRQANTPGLDRAEALRQASLVILDEPGGRRAPPSFWAPFTRIGEAGPVTGR
jgi:CHAT domain-containing protein